MVFCDTCAFVRSCSDCLGGVYYTCKKAKVVSREPNPICNSCTVETNAQKNMKNDCPNYKKRKWWQMLWANCNG